VRYFQLKCTRNYSIWLPGSALSHSHRATIWTPWDGRGKGRRRIRVKWEKKWGKGGRRGKRRGGNFAPTIGVEKDRPFAKIKECIFNIEQ